MNKFFAMMVALLATVFATSAFAWDPPPSPAPTSWISDPGHVLSADAHARLDAKLKVINQSSANEMAALILPSLNGESIEDAGDLTAKAWGVGKKNLDNGVLVVLAMKEHKSRISTGKGVEGDLPDLKANDILQAMRPYLRSGNVEGALAYAFDQSSTLIANHKAEAAAQAAKGVTAPAPATPQPQTTSTNNGGCQVAAPGSDTSVWPWALALLGVGLLGWYLSRRSAARSRERMALIEAETQAMLRDQRARQERLQREAQMSIPTPVVEVPVVPSVSRPVAPSFPVAPVAAVAAVVATEEAPRPQHHTAPKKHHHTSHSSSSSSSSSSDSSSSFNWGGGSSGGGSDSGGFGGGGFGGGGSSSDW